MKYLENLNELGNSESQLVAEFYYRMKVLNVPVFLHEKIFSPIHRSHEFVPDALVGFPIGCAVEFKREGRKPGKRTRQQRAYDSTGLPWRYCIGFSQLEDTITWVLKILEKD